MKKPSLEVAMIVITEGNKFILQKRGFDKNLGKSGLIGFFGGKKDEEEDRTLQDTAYRELDEEVAIGLTDITLSSSLGIVNVNMLIEGKETEVKAEAFGLVIPDGTDVKAKEYELVKMSEPEILKNTDQLTPATEKYFEEIHKRK